MQIQTLNSPRLDDILDGMRKFAIAGGRSTKIILLAQNICQKVTSGDYASEVLALTYWVCQNTRYVSDPTDVELVKDPERLIQTGSGDCDDIAVLCAALLMAIGKRVAFMMVAFKNNPMPSHIFAVVQTPNGWVPVDPVANRVTPQMLKDATRKWIVPITDGAVAGGAYGGLGASNPAGQQPVMTFSVFDYQRNLYNYYDVGASTPPTAWFRRPYEAIQGKPSGLFSCTEVLAVRLPPGAQHRGTGPDARGAVAVQSSSIGSVDPAGVQPPKGGGNGLLALLAGIFLGVVFGRKA